MAISRYRNTKILFNGAEEYQEILDKRGVSDIMQYSFDRLTPLTYDNLEGVTIETEVWSPASRFYKLAHKYYGDSRYWWIIAYFNGTPLETDLTRGQDVFIPVPLDMVLAALEI
ncbi:MAG: hypothetical protein GOVbin630_34 [Prokaryotic dsDNA virus sp.]|nr:MAG: hypothetical protein GOVbin630_34 [Prokaryotic dsDNA virus sp.]|tara:strand:- start:27348 stop:27689 length:342 start_codon:yes stop_codon:yes gene_type:complete